MAVERGLGAAYLPVCLLTPEHRAPLSACPSVNADSSRLCGVDHNTLPLHVRPGYLAELKMGQGQAV